MSSMPRTKRSKSKALRYVRKKYKHVSCLCTSRDHKFHIDPYNIGVLVLPGGKYALRDAAFMHLQCLYSLSFSVNGSCW